MVDFSNESNGDRNEYFSRKHAPVADRFSSQWMSADASIFITEKQLLDQYSRALKQVSKNKKSDLRGGLEKDAGDQGPLISDELKERVRETDPSPEGAMNRALAWMKDIGDID